MAKNLEISVLLDFYGEMLTEKQREMIELYYNDDLSLAEIAESEGISRQGVWDIIRRAEESLRRYEERTGLVARFAKERETLSELDGKLSELAALTRDDARALAEDIRKDLRELQHGV